MSDSEPVQHGGMCPHCGKLAVKDLNVFPQRMWRGSSQRWRCEHCQKSIIRHERRNPPPYGYGPWERVM